MKIPENAQKYPEKYHPERTICKWRWSYPVIHMSRGEIRTCDKPINIQLTEEDFVKYGTDAFINNPYLKERRKEKLEGFKHSDCFTCIKLEERGIQSTRTGSGPFMEWMNNVVGSKMTFDEMTQNPTDDMLRADHPDILEISLSNVCNLKCIYCSPTFSTLWEDEEIKLGRMKPENKESRQFSAPPSMEKYFWEWVDKIKGSLKRVIFIGGEPLYHPKMYNYLEKFAEIFENRDPYNKVWINIISNFGVTESTFDKLCSLLPKLTEKFNLHIEASGEAWGEKFEYIREGCDFKIYQRNIEKLLSLKQPGVYFGLQFAINALCISSLKNLLEYAVHLQNKYQVAVDFKQNVVVAPEYLSPYILTEDFAKYVDDAIEYTEEYLVNPEKNKAHFGYMASCDRWKEFLPFLKSISYGIKNSKNVDHLRKQFVDFVHHNGRVRNRDFEKIFPEYMDFYRHSIKA